MRGRPGRWARTDLAIVALLAFTFAAPVFGQEPEPAATEAADAPAEAPHVDALVEEAAQLEARIEELLGRRNEFNARMERAQGEELLILEEQNWRRQLSFHQTIRLLTQNTLRQTRDELDVAEQQKRLQALWKQSLPAYVAVTKWRDKKLSGLRAELEEAPEENRLGIEQQATEQESRLQNTFRVSLEAFELAKSVDVEAEKYRSEVTRLLESRGELLAGRVRLLARERSDLRRRKEAKPDDAAVESQLTLAENRFETVTEHLTATIALMAKLDLPTAEYQQLLIESTGEITAGLLDREVIVGLFDNWRSQMIAEVRNRGSAWLAKAFVFVLIVLLFRLLASVVRRIVSRSLASSRINISKLLEKMLVSWSSRIIMLVGLLVAFSQLGIEIGPLLAGLGIAGFVLGFALQDSLSNFASGAMILMYRPFDVGDVIEAATVTGQVREMSLVSTTILTFDNQTLIVPNTKIWGDVIRNVTAQKTRRVDLLFGIDYGEDIDRAERVIRAVLAENDKILDEPKPIIEVHSLGDSSVDIAVRPWVKTEDYWSAYWGLTRAIKQRFDAEGLRFPFPQRDVHHHFPEPPGDEPV
jgi:small conductance mechanosensitive channel